MITNNYAMGRILLGRVLHGEDLLDSVERFCAENNVTLGLVTAIGAVKNASVSYYRQSEKRYENLRFDEHMEIVTCFGNVSLRDGKPMLHAHILLSGPNGEARGGHLIRGTEVFACEICVQELKGAQLVRAYDEVTGLNLWPIGNHETHEKR